MTSGFAPEFGKTTGMVYNVVTPSGTNDIGGNAPAIASGRKAFSARPFLSRDPTILSRIPTPTRLPGRSVDPIRTDKAHYYFGYEKVTARSCPPTG